MSEKRMDRAVVSRDSENRTIIIILNENIELALSYPKNTT